jgi:AraC-like DNA-binding protein
LQQQLQRQAACGTRTLKCFAGLCESAVPVRVGPDLVAFLHTGQVLLHSPTRGDFGCVAQRLIQWGVEVDLGAAEEAYFQTRVLQPSQYRSLLRLLEIFSGHLAGVCEELLLRATAVEPPAVANARRLLAIHHPEPLSLPQVARAVNVSATYFSRCFKAATGLTFTDYLARVRVQKARSLLQNPRLRISEIAFEVGFQSLSQFNRAFRRINGRAPRELRNGA